MTTDELLVVLIEECGEVIQAATKCLRFGFSTTGPNGYGVNSEVLSAEVGDLLGMIDALPLDRPVAFWIYKKDLAAALPRPAERAAEAQKGNSP